MDNRIKAAEWEVQLSKEKGNDQQWLQFREIIVCIE
jgi:hypothetical protein